MQSESLKQQESKETLTNKKLTALKYLFPIRQLLIRVRVSSQKSKKWPLMKSMVSMVFNIKPSIPELKEIPN